MRFENCIVCFSIISIVLSLGYCDSIVCFDKNAMYLWFVLILSYSRFRKILPS